MKPVTDSTRGWGRFASPSSTSYLPRARSTSVPLPPRGICRPATHRRTRAHPRKPCDPCRSACRSPTRLRRRRRSCTDNVRHHAASRLSTSPSTLCRPETSSSPAPFCPPRRCLRTHAATHTEWCTPPFASPAQTPQSTRPHFSCAASRGRGVARCQIRLRTVGRRRTRAFLLPDSGLLKVCLRTGLSQLSPKRTGRTSRRSPTLRRTPPRLRSGTRRGRADGFRKTLPRSDCRTCRAWFLSRASSRGTPRLRTRRRSAGGSCETRPPF
mmetsp:Transcript_40737/g.125791  ORF Transcript_40737/g.125791 Transcript_40737/m.125791 type:complete len:269 (+) Transcript_40737:931-1737(+)